MTLPVEPEPLVRALREGSTKLELARRQLRRGLPLGELRLLLIGSNVVFVNGSVLVCVAPASASRAVVDRAGAIPRRWEPVA